MCLMGKHVAICTRRHPRVGHHVKQECMVTSPNKIFIIVNSFSDVFLFVVLFQCVCCCLLFVKGDDDHEEV